MQQVEQQIITKRDPRWHVTDAVCFPSKNLYNVALYELWQHFFATDETHSYNQMDKHLTQNVDYCALSRKVSQWVLRPVDHDWQAFWAAHKVYKARPEKFTGRPRLPRYKHKTDRRNVLTYICQVFSKTKLQQGIVASSQLNIEVRIQVDSETIQQVRIVPCKTHYVVELVYTETIYLAQANPDKMASIDAGFNNPAAVTLNQPGLCLLQVNGRPLKSINQHYNKVRAKLQTQLPVGQFTSKRLKRLADQRNRQIKHYLHQASRWLIQELVKNGIGTLVIGQNDGWKQGIDTDKRIHRSLFQVSDGRLLNADVNGSANIIRKVVPNAFANGIDTVVVSPVRVAITA